MGSGARERPMGALRFVGRLSVAYVVLALAFHLVGPRTAAPLLPFLDLGMELTHPDFDVRALTIQAGQLHLEADVRVPGRTGHRTIPATLELPVAQLFACPVLALALLCAWPHRSRREALAAVAVAIPLVVLAEILDVPYDFAGALAEKLSPPGIPPGGPGAFWWFFLDNGGRQLLALLVAPISVLGSRGLLLALRPSQDRPAHTVSTKRSRRSRSVPRSPQSPAESAAASLVLRDGQHRPRLPSP